MNQQKLSFLRLTVIGIFSGTILLGILKGIQMISGNQAYRLLINFDYIPGIKDLRPVWLFGYLFHYLTCIVSIFVLYHLLSFFNYQRRTFLYVLVFSAGGGMLFFLTALSNQPPASNDGEAWVYWTLAHGAFGMAAGLKIKYSALFS